MSPLPVAETAEFNVHLSNFTGPFDLLLQLISKHRLDVTEVALSQVTDDFVAHIKLATAANGPGWWDLDQTSSVIVIAATLLDLKAARLLPQGEVDDLEDLALLEARDLLFARLLQYRAFKLVSAWIAGTLRTQARRNPRPGGLEERFAKLLPEVKLDGFADVIAIMAGRALTPRESPQVSLTHLHAPLVSVREQADLLVQRLRSHTSLSFRALTADAADRLVVVARFLALLEARDLLFARLLQYRAFKLVSAWLAGTLGAQARRYPRPGGLEERFAKLLPDVVLDGFADVIAIMAGRALSPRDEPQVSLTHLHVPLVSVREQADLLVQRLRSHTSLSFRALTADAADRLVVVARFLALLELFREGAVNFEQLTPLGELTVRWLGAEVDADRISTEFDEPPHTQENE